MARRSPDSTDDATAALFALPLDQFTAARNALAATLKKNGQAAEAAGVKALAKPSASAWAVNQLHWQQPRALAALLAAGDRFKQAQRAQLEGRRGDVRATLETWRAALSDVSSRVATLLRDAGHAPTPDLMRRVSSTLETVGMGSAAPDGPRAGYLTVDLSPPGFEALAALIPRSTSGSSGGAGAHGHVGHRVVQFGGGAARETEAPAPSPAKVRAAARKAIDRAQKALAAARTAARAAEQVLKRAAGRARLASERRAAAERQKADADAQLDAAVTAAEAATAEARTLARAAEDAAQAVADAERALDQARRSLGD